MNAPAALCGPPRATRHPYFRRRVTRVSEFDPTAALMAAANGDQRAWESIVAAYAGLVWSVARGFRLSAADASDVFQGTWLRLVEHLGDIRDGSRLGGWLATTARREALMLMRRAGRDVPVDTADTFGDVAGHAPSLDEHLIRDEEHRMLWQAFAGLSASCQRLLRIAFADPPPRYEEISAALDIPVGSIGPTRARCLASLHNLLPHTAQD
jgi:RNA polymerase sigma factor (sigma-70 family)